MYNNFTNSLRATRSGDRIPVKARYSAPVQTGRGARSAPCTMGTRSFPGGKWPERGSNHPPHLARRLKEEQRYTLLTLCTSMTGYTVNFNFHRQFHSVSSYLYNCRSGCGCKTWFIGFFKNLVSWFLGERRGLKMLDNIWTFRGGGKDRVGKN